MKDRFVELTNSVYRVLEYFPEGDPLRSRAKEKALYIMEQLIIGEEQKQNLINDIDTLLGYLWIGKTQGWLNASSCLIIFSEYEKIIHYLQSEDKKEKEKQNEQVVLKVQNYPVAPPVTKQPVIAPVAKGNTTFNDRQKKIIDFLIKNEKAQVVDLQTVLPDVTKRTIRRDLDQLLGANKVARFGEFNQVFYRRVG